MHSLIYNECEYSYWRYSIQHHLLVHVTYGNQALQLPFMSIPQFSHVVFILHYVLTFNWVEKASRDIWSHWIKIRKVTLQNLSEMLALQCVCQDVAFSNLFEFSRSEILKTRLWLHILFCNLSHRNWQFMQPKKQPRIWQRLDLSFCLVFSWNVVFFPPTLLSIHSFRHIFSFPLETNFLIIYLLWYKMHLISIFDFMFSK